MNESNKLRYLHSDNIYNLYEFANGKFTLLVTPLKLAGASGSPIRAMGIEE
ncbi:MAG: hypothetical protein ACJ71G_16780 [Nitrososphaeraceae archaeon]